MPVAADPTDLTVVEAPGGRVLVVTHENGHLTHFRFDERWNVATGRTLVFGSALAVAGADLDGDGFPDLVVCNDVPATANDVITVLLGRASGDFAPFRDFAAGVQPVGLALDDLDGDGHVDAAVTLTDDHISVLYGVGDGTFEPAQSVPLGGRPHPRVRIADLDQDGDRDLVVQVGKHITACLNRGDRSWRLELTEIPYRHEWDAPWDVVASSLVGDPLPDLALARENGIRIYRNTGGGRFELESSVSSGRVYSLALGDLDGDDLDDLVLGRSQRLGRVRRQSDGGFAELFDAPSAQRPRRLCLADLNGDGHLDAATLDTYDGALAIHPGDGTGELGRTRRFDPSAAGAMIQSGSFDFDGVADVVVAEPTTWSFYRGHSNGLVRVSGPYRLPGHTEQILVADLTGSDALDVLAVSRSFDTEYRAVLQVFEGDGYGAFTPLDTVVAGFRLNGAAVGDLDGDDQTDVVVSQHGSPYRLLVFHGGPTGLRRGPDLPVGERPNRITVADIDRDGDQDIVVAHSASLLSVARQEDGVFRVDQWPAPDGIVDLAAVDLDGDAGMEVVTSGSRGIAVFDDDMSYATVFDGNTGDLHVADLDGDGRVEVLARMHTTASIALFEPGNWTRTEWGVGATTLFFPTFTTGDFDGDGRTDIATSDGVLLLGAHDATTPVLPGAIDVRVDQGTVTLRWHLDHEVGLAIVERSRDGAAWTEIARARPSRPGVLEIVDRPPGGARWGYRLRADGDTETVTTWVELPETSVLRAVTPSRRVIEFETSMQGPARCELVDVAGRVVIARDLTIAGRSTLEGVQALRPGVYFLRVIQGSRSATQRIVFLRD